MDKQSFHHMIKSQIRAMEEKISKYETMAQPISPENSIGRVSRMDAINNKSVVDAAIRAAKEKLSALKSMSHHIDDEDFGLCRKCKQPIPEKRLLLIPESVYCVRCAAR